MPQTRRHRPRLSYNSASLPWVRAEANIDLVNSWTKLARNHTIKWGGDLRRVRDDLPQDQTFSPRGVISFGSFLLGLPSSVGRDVNTYFPAMRLWQTFLFLADNWQVSPRFTVTAGVRWEFYPPAVPRFPGGFSNYDFVHNQLVIAGVGDNPMNLGMVTRYNYYAPRLGTAYRLTAKTLIRTGFGMSYTPFPDNNYAYNFPVRSNNTYGTGTSSYLPAVDPTRNNASITLGTGFPAIRPVEVPLDGIIRNPDITSAYFVVPQDFKNPYVLTWNFAIQRQLPWHWNLDMAYVATHGVHIAASPNLNAGRVIGRRTRPRLSAPRPSPNSFRASTPITT